jgi:hypothetical protein
VSSRLQGASGEQLGVYRSADPNDVHFGGLYLSSPGTYMRYSTVQHSKLTCKTHFLPGTGQLRWWAGSAHSSTVRPEQLKSLIAASLLRAGSPARGALAACTYSTSILLSVQLHIINLNRSSH